MRHIREVTGMRGVAALLVVVCHIALFSTALDHTVYRARPVLFYGWIGVDFFFVLSAFLLSMPFLEAGQRPTVSSLKEFYFKRWLRVAPAYYVSIPIVLVMFNKLSYLGSNPWDILQHLTYTHSFHSVNFASINAPYWTLAVEFQFYLLLPLLVLAFRRKWWPAMVAAMFVATFAWRASVPYDNGELRFWWGAQLPAFLAHFGVGIAAAKMYVSGWRPRIAAGPAIGAVAILFVALPLGLLARPEYMFQDVETWASIVGVRPLLALGFGAIIFLATTQASTVQRFLLTAPVQFLGEISYSLYLFNFSILIFVIIQFPEVAHLGLGLYTASMLVLNVALAWVYYRLVELPFLGLKIRATGTPPKPSRVPMSVPAARTPTPADA